MEEEVCRLTAAHQWCAVDRQWLLAAGVEAQVVVGVMTTGMVVAEGGEEGRGGGAIRHRPSEGGWRGIRGGVVVVDWLLVVEWPACLSYSCHR